MRLRRNTFRSAARRRSGVSRQGKRPRDTSALRRSGYRIGRHAPAGSGSHRSGWRRRHSFLPHLRWLRSHRQENWGSRHDASGREEGPFLRTYSSQVSLFVTDDSDVECALRTQLSAAGIKLAHQPLRVDQRNERIVVLCEGGESHLMDILYPALGCDVRSQLATNLGAKCTEIGTLEVDAHQQTTVEGIYAVDTVITVNGIF